jgi:hypothetical protein
MFQWVTWNCLKSSGTGAHYEQCFFQNNHCKRYFLSEFILASLCSHLKTILARIEICGGPSSLMNYHSESTGSSFFFWPGVSIIMKHQEENCILCSVAFTVSPLSTEEKPRLHIQFSVAIKLYQCATWILFIGHKNKPWIGVCSNAIYWW